MPKFEGFNRIMIGPHEAVSPKRAEQMGLYYPDVGFLRKDGWSLGAPEHLESDAFRMWADEWTHFTRKPEVEWKPISEY